MTTGSGVAERPTRAALAAEGEAARSRLPIAAHSDWKPAADRPDPVALLEAQGATRVPELVPVRYGRMSASPFAFYRGGALPMAADLAPNPNSGIVTQLCGDAHLSNFGLFASPERDLLFDVTDFDETLHGPFEWDLKRLAASLVVAARGRGFDAHAGRHAVHRTVGVYRERMAEYAAMRSIDVYYSAVSVTSIRTFVDKRARPLIDATVKTAARHTALHVLPKLTAMVDGSRRIVDHPPVIVHGPDITVDRVQAIIGAFRESLEEDRRVLFDRYAVADVALKVVGVGSVGLGAYAALFVGSADDDPLFLQVKEAEASVLERFLGPSHQPTHGARVVAGQRRLQAHSDVLLGHAVGSGGRHWYIRQLQDQKGSAVVEAMTPDDLATWGELCGWALARGHARSGEPATIAAYLGTDDAMDKALGKFAEAYADQTERDFAAFTSAIRTGRIAAETGV